MNAQEDNTGGIRALARELNDEPDHAFQVCSNSLQLFDATTELHGMGRHERALLEAAALLHDIGLRHGAQGHHKRSRDMILKLDLPGFTPDEHAIIACVARYHRKAHPDPAHKEFGNLGRITQGVVRALAALLRIGDGLDRSHVSSARRIRARIGPGEVVIQVQQDPANDLDLWGASRKRQLFEEVFGLPVRIERREM